MNNYQWKKILISGIHIIVIKLLGKNSNDNNRNLKGDEYRIKVNSICAWRAKITKTQKIDCPSYDIKWGVFDYVSMLSKHIFLAIIFI